MAPPYILLLICCWPMTSVLSAVVRPVYLGYQDSFGQYSFGYSAPSSARSEVRTLDGITRGAYSYIDDAGVIQKAEYIVDGDNGFRIIASNLPQAPLPVLETPEVTAAREAHFEAVKMAVQLAQQTSKENSHSKNSTSLETSSKIDQTVETEANERSTPESVQQRDATDLSNVSNLKEIKHSNAKNKTDGNQKNSTTINQASTEKATIEQNVEDSNKLSNAASKIGSANLIRGQSVPVYEILPGSLEIRTTGFQEASNLQGISESTAPLKSALVIDQPKNRGIENQETPLKDQRSSNQRQDATTNASQAALVRFNVLPTFSAYSTFHRHSQHLPYVLYGVV